MKKLLSIFLAAMLLIIQPVCFSAYAADCSEIDFAADNTEFAIESAKIISGADSDSAKMRIIGKFSARPSDALFSQAENAVISESGRFLLQFSNEKDLAACLEKLKACPEILYAEQDSTVYTNSADDYLSWGVQAIEADVYSESITLPSEGGSVTVAIVDSGCEDIDFIKDKLVQGYDFVDNDTDAANDESIDSHGTFLASIVADCTRSLPVEIMPVRVLKSKSGSLSNAVNGIYYAVDNGADIVNISLGGIMNNCSSLDDALSYAEQHNVTVVVCAGNSRLDIEENYCPAHNPSALTVTSVDAENGFSRSFSNYGKMVDLAAPGENIIGYNASGEQVTLSGTSMSAAYVSSAAAMFRLKHPRCNTEQVRNALISCAVDCGSTGFDVYYGWGVLRLGKLAESDITYVESVALEQEKFSLTVGDEINIFPSVFPADATDTAYTLSADNGCISISGNTVTAVSGGKAILTVTSSDGAYTDTAEITVRERITAVLRIRNNTGTKEINYGETLRLTADVTDMPENVLICWYADGKKIGTGATADVTPAGKSTAVTAKLVDTNGDAVIDINGNEVFDSQTVTVNAGFFQRLISFFKNLFRLNRTVIQSVIRNA